MSLNIAEDTVATRRGMLFGMTLAEVMLIVLFCILLLLSSTALEKEKAIQHSTSYEPITSIVTPTTAHALARFVKREQEQMAVGDDPAKYWDTLTNKPQNEASAITENAGLRIKIDEQATQIEDLQDKNNKTEEALKETKVRGENLVDVIRKAKAGDPPSCLFYIGPSKKDGTKKRTLALGTVHVENEQLTLVTKNTDIPELNPIDFLDQPADWVEPYGILESWPQGKPMSFAEFGTYGQQFFDISDVETETKLKCRFMMDYIFEDGSKLDVFENVFQKYFYKNIRRQM